jgi:hypothetical protein
MSMVNQGGGGGSNHRVPAGISCCSPAGQVSFTWSVTTTNLVREVRPKVASNHALKSMGQSVSAVPMTDHPTAADSLKAVLQQYPQCSAIRRKSLPLSGKPRILGCFYCDLNHCRLPEPPPGCRVRGRPMFAALNAGLTAPQCTQRTAPLARGSRKGYF